MVGGSQELIFLSSLSLPIFFFSFTLCFVCLGLDLDRNSAVGDVLDMPASGST